MSDSIFVPILCVKVLRFFYANILLFVGTGNWATIELTKNSIPATMIANSLFARFISNYKD